MYVTVDNIFFPNKLLYWDYSLQDFFKHLMNKSNKFVIYGWVVKIDLLVNILTYWPAVWSIYRVKLVG